MYIKSSIRLFLLTIFTIYITGCSSLYYATWEKLGKEKRDLLKDSVTSAKNEQEEIKTQFKDSLTALRATYSQKDTDLSKKYDKLNSEYEDTVSETKNFRHRIDKMNDIAVDLFDEWKVEAESMSNSTLKNSSLQKLDTTKRSFSTLKSKLEARYNEMTPVLTSFRDHVLYLKHNLNSQSISSLQGESEDIERGLEDLIIKMNSSINETDNFLKEM